MGPMQRLIDSYRTHNEEAIFSDVLSNDENRKVVELWLKNHPLNIAESPMLTDLRNRITHAPGSAPFEQGIIDSEEKILSGKFNEISLPGQIDLIKTHVELKTLTDVKNLLPLLLDHVSTKDIAEILKNSDPLTTLPSLTNAQWLRLSAILALPDMPKLALPPLAQQMMQIVQKPEKDLANDIKAIKSLEGLTDEERNGALAHYIERYKIPLKDVKEQLSGEELLQLAPYLRYVDFRSFENVSLANKLLKECRNLNTLFVGNDKILEDIKELPQCQTLDCHSCPLLSALPALPLCQTLNCSFCPLLSALPALPLCQTLNCSSCPLLSALPALPLCQTLDCRHCLLLSALPALPLCQKLYCNRCPLLSALPALSLCQELYCYSCPLLSALPALPLCQELRCYDCPLTELPALPLCQELDCNSCPLLSALPALPGCRELRCYGCPLTELPALPICHTLNCTSSPLLSALSALPLCQELYCFSCPLLSALPALPQCQKLYCHSCPLLSALPALPLCQVLRCYGCPLTELPEMPWNAHVVTADEGYRGLPFTSLDIPIEKFETEPVSLLLQLGDHLLNNKPFPNIYYFEKGERNVAVDLGGVRRDFVTKLCLNLFKELKLENNFPMASDNEEKAYRSLGALLAQCYPENAVYKTGPLFAPELYACLLTPDPGTDEWFLTNYLMLINAPAPDLFLSSQPSPKRLKLNDLTTLAYLAEPEAGDISKYTQEYFNDPDNRVNVSKAILKRAKQDPRLKAISWMAQEIRKKIPDLTGNLKERIEGVLNPIALKRKLTWELTKSSPTQEYLIHWIDHHPEQLEKFVYAVTGNRTLCSENLKIQVFDRDKDFIPVAHTCSFALELSGNYENQAAFDKKIEYFLDHALAGSGFTMA